MRCEKRLGNKLSGLGAQLGVPRAAPGFLSWGAQWAVASAAERALEK